MLYYLHGYQSSPNSTKALLFKKTLHATAIPYRSSPPEDLIISECLTRISSAIRNDHQATLIGSSLGGFLAASIALNHTNVTRLILLNPAIIPPKTDVSKIKGVPQRILKEMIDKRLFEQKISAPITILRGTDDTVVPDDWILSFAKAQEATLILLHDDHRFSKNLEHLPSFISEIIQQETQEL